MNTIKKSLQFAGYFVLVVWSVFLLNHLLFGINLNGYGIVPRSISGLRGILFSPFLHGSFQHISSNTVPLFVLLFSVRYFVPRKAIDAIALIVLLGGLLTWIFARSAVHIGASGLIYGLATYLIFNGYYQRNAKAIIVSLVIVVLYGGLVYGLLPTNPNVSFEGHIFGAVAGFLVSRQQATKKSKRWI